MLGHETWSYARVTVVLKESMTMPRVYQQFLLALETWIDSGCPITIVR